MRELPQGKKVDKCRICGGDIIEILDLGHHPPSDKFLTQDELNEPEITYPLRLFYCPECTFAQLDYIVPKEVLFAEDYPYETGVNQGGIVHFHNFADEVYEKYGRPDSFVVDIGGNDGTFLEGFALHGCKVLNVDPCGVKSKVMAWKGFWNSSTAKEINAQFGQADIITATNVLAHCEDLHDFMDAVSTLLKDDGVLVIETPSLDAMIDGLQFDQIYHEHLGYFNGYDIENLVNRHSFGIYNLEFNDFHGGSLRLYIKRNWKACFEDIPDWLTRLKEFAEKVRSLRFVIRDYVYNHCTAGVAASAKGNTLLNYCGITKHDLAWITDKSKLKQDKYAPGSHLWVVDDDALLKLGENDCVLMLACNFKKNIVKAVREKGYKGKFLIPYPEVHIE